MFGDKNLIAIFGRKHRARVKPHSDSSHVRGQIDRRRCELGTGLSPDIGIRDGAGVAVRKTEIHTFSGRVIQLIGRNLVAQVVAAIVGKPQFFRLGMPVKTDGVADTASKNFKARSVGVHSIDDSVPLIRPADVAWRTDRHVQQAIRPERDEFPAMMCFVGKFVVDNNRLGRILELGFDVVVACDARHFCHVQRAVPEGYAAWHVQSIGDLDHFVGPIVAIMINNRINIAGIHRTGEESTVRTKRHLSRVGYACGIDADAETGRQLDFVKRQRLVAASGACNQSDGQTWQHISDTVFPHPRSLYADRF